MTIIFKGARLYSPSSPHHLQTTDIFIEDGIIRSINNLPENDAEVLDAAGLTLSPTFLDFFSHFNDPGFEFKETVESGAAAALAGGYTTVMPLPNNDPATDKAVQVNFLKNRTSIIEIVPLGAVTINNAGKELAEMYDMAANGAVAFTDGTHPIQDAGIMLKALQYVKANNTTLIQMPRTKSLAKNGLMHEGVLSTRLGLPGIPTLTEELMVNRDIELLRYTGSRLHLTGVSTKKSFDLIRAAKEEGLQITCSVAPYQLAFTDEDLAGYDANLKVYPPLRDNASKTAIFEALTDGTIDGVAAHHLPQSWDDKEKEFEYAAEGMTGLQTAYAVLCSYLTPEKAIELLAFSNRRIFNMPVPSIMEGEMASFVLTDPAGNFTLTKENNRSRSVNSPFFNKQLRGKVIGVYHNKKWWPND